MSRRRRAVALVAVVLALLIASPVLAIKPDKGDGKPGKGEGPPSHAHSIWNRTPAPTPTPDPPPHPVPPPTPPPRHPDPAPVAPPVLVLPDTAMPEA